MTSDAVDSDHAIGLAEWLASDQAKNVQGYLEGRILKALFSYDPSSLEFQRTIARLAWLGSCPQAKPLLEREIVALNLLNEYSVETCGFFKDVGKVCRATGRFIANHAVEIGVGAALCATGVGIACVTGYALSASIGGVVVAGAGSLFAASEKELNPNLPKLPLPDLKACSKEEAALMHQPCISALPKVEFPSSVDQVLVAADGIWAGGNFYPLPTANNSAAASLAGYPADWRAYTSYTLAMQLTQNSPCYSRGENALALGQYSQAVRDLSQSIQETPASPISYLHRGAAHFHLQEYDRALQDYREFLSQEQREAVPLSISEFSLGLLKGLPKGVWESGEGLFIFLGEFAKSPIQTSKQVINSVNSLVELVRRDEWGEIVQSLSPELHELVTQWDTLSSDAKGELAGYAIGKHGSDILLPGALAKVAAKSIQSAQELAAFCKNIQIAQDTLLVEAAAGVGSSVKIGEIIQAGQRTIGMAEELGFSTYEMRQLKQAGNLEAAVAKSYDGLSGALQESYALYDKAQEALKPFTKKPLPEFTVRELIHEAGLPTFPRPKGIPENYLVMISRAGAGMEYVHPKNANIRVRVMPGKPHSPNPYQQKPYVIHQKNGQFLDKNGGSLNVNGMQFTRNSPEVHISIEDFLYVE